MNGIWSPDTNKAEVFFSGRFALVLLEEQNKQTTKHCHRRNFILVTGVIKHLMR